jgi:hypothetical protein
MIPVTTIPGMRGGRIKESYGGGEFKYKCHNVPPPSTIIIKKKKNQQNGLEVSFKQ